MQKPKGRISLKYFEKYDLNLEMSLKMIIFAAHIILHNQINYQLQVYSYDGCLQDSRLYHQQIQEGKRRGDRRNETPQIAIFHSTRDLDT